MRHLIYIVLIAVLAGCSSMNSVMLFEYYPKDPGIESSYDRYDQNWAIETTENAVYREGGLSINSDAMIVCQEPENCKPQMVSLSFITMSMDWRFLDYRELQIHIDGQTHNFSPNHDGQVLSANKVNEYIDVQIPFELFKKLATNKNVSARLGAYELDMSYETRETYRLLLNKIDS